MFERGMKVAIGASGGKDSTVLAYLLCKLNDKYNYGLELILLSIDEGIEGYRDQSLEAVEKNRVDYGLPLTVLSYEDLYGWTMDNIVGEIGSKNNCTFCGVFRRRALDRGAQICGADVIATGHNADDMAETILLNILRGDIGRLQRCTDAVTGSEQGLPRVKPLKHIIEKDLVMYAHFNRLHYFSTECKYARDSFRGYVRKYVKELQRLRPTAILDIIYSGESVQVRNEIIFPELKICERCKCASSQKLCKACLLLEGLNTGNHKLGIKKKTSQGTTTRDKKNQQPCACLSDEDNPIF